jgi:pimeloyl-ACP methyl ester carboxylesterase
MSWKDDYVDLAELISKISSPLAQVHLIGYSWGGYTVTLLAAELMRRGFPVEHMILSDPVYRHFYWLGQWRAFCPGIPIHIPTNVKAVTHFAQTQTWLRAHRLVANDPERTYLPDPVMLKRDHGWMDDAPEFFNACLDTGPVGPKVRSNEPTKISQATDMPLTALEPTLPGTGAKDRPTA